MSKPVRIDIDTVGNGAQVRLSYQTRPLVYVHFPSMEQALAWVQRADFHGAWTAINGDRTRLNAWEP